MEIPAWMRGRVSKIETPAITNLGAMKVLQYICCGFGLVTVLLLTGCTCCAPPVPKEHIVVVNRNGQSLAPDKSNPNEHFLDVESTNGFSAHLYAITNEIENSAIHAPNDANTNTIRILIFIHGGLNSYSSSMTTATNAMSAIIAQHYYPIFINWNSGLISSYGEHLFLIRQGKVEKFWGIVTSPLCLVADLGAAVTRAPFVAYYQFADDISTTSKYPHESKSRESDSAGLHLLIGQDDRDTLNEAWYSTTYFLTLPTKLILAPIIDAGGKNAWDNMYRRTQTMFRSPEEFEQVQPPRDIEVAERRVGEPPQGGIGQLMQEINDLVECDRAHHYSITLVGHSMGAIVANEIIRTYPNLPYTNIVYMAAACSVNDFADSVIPYLERSTNANFYNLCLHPVADRRDQEYFFPPRGSLLEWIDNFFGNPTIIPARTLGDWDNIISSTALIPKDVENRIWIKAFAVGPKDRIPKNTPLKHGDFSQLPFWEESFWTNNPDTNVPSVKEIKSNMGL